VEPAAPYAAPPHRTHDEHQRTELRAIPSPERDDSWMSEVIRLRLQGTRTTYPLQEIFDSSAGRLALDSGARVQVARVAAAGHIPVWHVEGVDGGAALMINGVRTRETTVVMGDEVSLAGEVLIAESRRSIALFEFCGLLLGWDAGRLLEVDQALRAIRHSMAGQFPLLLRGEGDLVQIAHMLHRKARPADAPFIAADPRREDGRATVRSPENHRSAVECVGRAVGGTVCVRTRRLPDDFDAAMEQVRTARQDVWVIGCVQRERDWRTPLALMGGLVNVPALEDRRAELDRVVRVCAAEAMAMLNAPRVLDLDGIESIVHESSLGGIPTIAGIAKAAERFVAMRMAGGVTRAAAMLGMAPVSLARWYGRRLHA
jgi:hypothetical protein